jgi:hypothetical protein
MKHPSNDIRSSVSWLALLLGVYAMAFLLPVDAARGVYGYEMFCWGALGSAFIVWLPWTWPWLANLAFYIGCLYLATGRRSREVRWSGVIATILALGYLLYGAGLFGMPSEAFPGAGYWVWVGSMVLLAVAGWAQDRAEKPEPVQVFRDEQELVRDAHAVENRMRRLLAELKHPGYREEAVAACSKNPDGELS